MIECVLILNSNGLLRFIKIYSEDQSGIKQKELVDNVYQAIEGSNGIQIIYEFDYLGEKRKLIYRNFGDVYIAMIIDDLENELAMLDFVNVIIKVFDDVFKGVTELHLINNPEKIYLIFDEMISGGMVIETNKNIITKAYFDKTNDNENYKFFQS